MWELTVCRVKLKLYVSMKFEKKMSILCVITTLILWILQNQPNIIDIYLEILKIIIETFSLTFYFHKAKSQCFCYIDINYNLWKNSLVYWLLLSKISFLFKIISKWISIIYYQFVYIPLRFVGVCITVRQQRRSNSGA